MNYVCNEEITIKYNNKVKTYRNYLLSSFLERFAKKSLGENVDFSMPMIFGIFTEDDITINENTKFEIPGFGSDDVYIIPLNTYLEDFQLTTDGTTMTETMEKNKITYTYKYDIISKKTMLAHPNFVGQKIGYLLFGNADDSIEDYDDYKNQIYAILDVRQDNIYWNEDANIDIFRKDYIETEGVITPVTSYPYHLRCSKTLYTTKLVGIGYGYNDKSVVENYPITDFQVVETNNKITISTKHLEPFDTENVDFPNNNIYCGDDIYPLVYTRPLKTKSRVGYSTFPSRTIRAGRKYPMKTSGNYKYVFLKYKSMDIGFGNEYYMAYPLETRDKFVIEIKYERKN